MMVLVQVMALHASLPNSNQSVKVVVERNTFNPSPVMLTHPASFNIFRLLTASILLKILSISSSDNLDARFFSISPKSNTSHLMADKLLCLFDQSRRQSLLLQMKIIQPTAWLNNLIYTNQYTIWKISDGWPLSRSSSSLAFLLIIIYDAPTLKKKMLTRCKTGANEICVLFFLLQ